MKKTQVDNGAMKNANKGMLAIFWCLVAVPVWASSATSSFIGWRETGGLDVGEGQSHALTSRLPVGDGGTFVKVGGGDLEVPLSALSAPGQVGRVVLDGTLRLNEGEVEDSSNPVPECMSAAASWFSAVDPSFISTKDTPASGSVDCWYDVRESGVWNEGFRPTYPYMKHKVGSNYTDTTDNQQTVAMFNGNHGVYFGGSAAVRKGGYMSLRSADGVSELTHAYVYNVFYVEGIDVGHGSVIGSRTNPCDFFVGGQMKTVGTTGYYYCRGDSVAAICGARHYRNCATFDPFCAVIERGTAVFGATFVDRPTQFATFFNQRDLECANGSTGGDYLHEVVVFTNRLTEAEVVEVNLYLAKKWGVAPVVDSIKRVGLGASGRVEVSAATDMNVTNYYPICLDGEGVLVKKGAGQFSLGSTMVAKFQGSLDLREGSVHSRYALIPPLLASAGKVYTASLIRNASGMDQNNGERVSVSDGTDATVVKAGGDDLSFSAIPDGVKELKVSGGLLRLAGHRTNSAVYAKSSALRATFVNPNAELVQYQGETTDRCRLRITKGTTRDGWTCSADSDGNVGYLVGPALSNTFWGYEVPEGSQALYIQNHVTAGKKSELYTSVSFPAAGDYLVSWRETRATPNSHPENDSCAYHVLFGTTWASAEEVGWRLAADGCYPRVFLRLSVPEAGEYAFGFRVDDSNNGAYYCITMDDFRADFVAKESERQVVRIPNGDFEHVYLRGSSDETLRSYNATKLPSIENVAKGWVFGQGDGWTDADPPSVALTSYSVPIQTVQRGNATLTTNARFSRYADAGSFGAVQLFMANVPGKSENNSAQTSFTVAEAGLYYLRARVSRWNASYSGVDYLGANGEVPVFSARVTIGDNEVSLGDVVVKGVIQSEVCWPTPFVVAEANELLVLTISQTAERSGGLLDDVVLVRAGAERDEYVANGSFEECVKNIRYASQVESWTSGVVTPGDSAGVNFWTGNAYLDDTSKSYTDVPFDGDVVCALRGDAWISQDLPPMDKGRYRFRFAGNTRRGSWAGYGENGVVATLHNKATGVDQTIYSTFAITNFEARVFEKEFDVEEAGSYTLRLIGSRAGIPDGKTSTVTCVLDGISIKRIFDVDKMAPSVPSSLCINVSRGAKLDLDYTGGALKVERVKYAGKSYWGVLSSATHPEFISGTGRLETTGKPNGLTLVVR